MTDLVIDKNKTCAVTGHRIIREPIDGKYLKKIFSELIDLGVDTFMIGMAIGFDTLCFKVLEDIRKKKKIRIIACIPCPEQSKNFKEKDKKIYEKLVNSADERLILSENYTSFCMQKRNIYMVDNSKYLVSYIREFKGGTYNTVKYAERKELIIINV